MLRSEETVTRALPTPLWTKNDMDDIFSAHVGPIPRVRLVNQTNTVKDFTLFKKLIVNLLNNYQKSKF